MTAEEYIESVGNTVVNGKAIVKSDFLPKIIAFKAVEIARKEEREKAMDAFDKVLSNMTYHISRGCRIEHLVAVEHNIEII